MTERQEQMIYDEGRRRGFNDGYEACRDELAEKMMERIEEDGTLVIGVQDATAVTRVLVEDDKKNGDLYYADRPQEWIPCSERLPEEKEWIGTKAFGTTISDEVLVTFESRGKRFVKPISFQNGELGGMDKRTMDVIYGEWKVVAWMPLPEPWKGADDEVR